MRICRCMLFVVMVAAIAYGGRPGFAQDASEPKATEELVPANSEETPVDLSQDSRSSASCWLRITAGDDEIRPETISMLMEGNRIVDAAIREVVSKETVERDLSEPRRRVNVLSMERSQRLNEKTMIFQIAAGSMDKRIAAKNLLHPAAKELEKSLKELDSSNAKHLHDELAAINQEVDRSEKQYEKLTKLVRRYLGFRQPRISRERLEENFQRLRSQRQELQLELFGLDARHGAIEERIAEIARRVEQEAISDEVIENLEEVLELRKRRLDHLHKPDIPLRKSVDEMTIDHARLELATASAELAKYRRSAIREAGGDQLSALNMRLTETEIEREEIAARVEYLVRQAIPEAAAGLTEVLEIETANRGGAQIAEKHEVEREMALQQWREAMGRQREIKRRWESYRAPTVTIIRND